MQQDLCVSAAQLLEGLGSAVLAGNPLPREDEPSLAFVLVPAGPESCHPLGIAAPHRENHPRDWSFSGGIYVIIGNRSAGCRGL